MIHPVDGGFQVPSQAGKNLSKVLPTRAAAQRRLAQVEAFKHMKAKKKK